MILSNANIRASRYTLEMSYSIIMALLVAIKKRQLVMLIFYMSVFYATIIVLLNKEFDKQNCLT